VNTKKGKESPSKVIATRGGGRKEAHKFKKYSEQDRKVEKKRISPIRWGFGLKKKCFGK